MIPCAFCVDHDRSNLRDEAQKRRVVFLLGPNGSARLAITRDYLETDLSMDPHQRHCGRNLVLVWCEAITAQGQVETADVYVLPVIYTKQCVHHKLNDFPVSVF